MKRNSEISRNKIDRKLSLAIDYLLLLRSTGSTKQPVKTTAGTSRSERFSPSNHVNPGWGHDETTKWTYGLVKEETCHVSNHAQ